MEEKLIKTTEKSIKKILDEGISTGNLEYLDKLVDIYKDAKEVQNMNGEYGNYGRNYYGEYGRYNDSYGRRGYDTKYRGEDKLEEMHGYYRDYNDYRGRYGAGEGSDKAFHYMAKSLGEFIRYLFEEAETPEQKNMLKDTIQKSTM